MKNLIFISPLVFSISGCKLDQTFESKEITDYKLKNQNFKNNEGQLNFIFDSMGSFSLRGLLKTNIMPIKIYGTALILVEEQRINRKLTEKDIPAIFESYGFLRPVTIVNWQKNLSNEPRIEGNLGLVHSTIEQNILGKKFKLEVANITCAACHSSVSYDQNGNPVKGAILGVGNTSLNFDGLLDQIYRGLKLGMKDKKAFLLKIKEVYPNISSDELDTIKSMILPKVDQTLSKFEKMNRVLPFPNGGPGHTNGIGGFKRDAGLLKNPFSFHGEESGFVGMPNLMDRGFKSSLTVDGAYGIKNKNRYFEVDEYLAKDEEHLNELGELANFFTFSAMGTTLKNIEVNIPKAQKIFTGFITNAKAPKFPGIINKEKALKGSEVYQKSCASCHGEYSYGVENVRLVFFPNKLVPQDEMKTDATRWQRVDKSVSDYAKRTLFNKHVDAGDTLGGYVAPMLGGIWAKAPYLHNGSVPTLWQLLNPKIRPTKFEIGGHAIDLEKVGIRGELVNGIYQYPKNYVPWSKSEIFDTTESGKSNIGHEESFDELTISEKEDVLEFMKLL